MKEGAETMSNPNLPEGYFRELMKTVSHERKEKTGERPLPKKHLFFQDISLVNILQHHTVFLCQMALDQAKTNIFLGPKNEQNYYFQILPKKFEEYNFKELDEVMGSAISYYSRNLKRSQLDSYLGKEIFLVKYHFENEYKKNISMNTHEKIVRIMQGVIANLNSHELKHDFWGMVLEFRKISFDRRPEDAISIKNRTMI